MPDALQYGCATAAAVVVVSAIDLLRTFTYIKAPKAAPLPEELGLPAPFAKLANARDVAAGAGMVSNDGRRLRRGLIYRSAKLHGLPSRDLKLLQQLGIRFVADFRSQDEAEREPDSFAPGHTVQHSLFEAVDEDPHKTMKRILFSGNFMTAGLTETRAWEILMDINRAFVTTHGPKFRAFLESLAEPGNLPALVHCTAGKDRTGWAIALLLLVLGIDKEAVFQDYLFSNELWHREARKFMVFIRLLSGFRVTPEACEPLLRVRSEYLEVAMNMASTSHGGLDTYLTAPDGLNLDPKVVQRLRALFLEDLPSSRL